MAENTIDNLLDTVRLLAADGAGPEAADGSLLARFADERDEAAFAALVRRHGAMVWGVCRRVLGHHDAEDAFQATFLVLARKAGGVSPLTVAAWLHGVAYRAACKARTARHRRREETGRPVAPVAAADVPSDDLGPVLDAELARLPERHRSAVVLCDLEGLNRREAAARLGVPEGTIAGWQARGRARLAAGLARRGITPAVVLASAAVARSAPPAAASLLALRSALPSATGEAVAASQTVAGLADGVSRAMMTTQLKPTLAAAVACAGLMTWAIAPHAAPSVAAESPRSAPATALPPKGAAAKPAKEQPEGTGDWVELKGDWRVVAAEVDGRKAAPAGKKPGPGEVGLPFNSLLVIPPKSAAAGEGALVWTTDGALFQEWPVTTLNPAAMPKALAVQTHGKNVLDMNKGLYKHAGIYRVAGDALTVCVGKGVWLGGKATSPAGFDAGEKTGNTLIALERMKTAPKRPITWTDLAGKWEVAALEVDGKTAVLTTSPDVRQPAVKDKNPAMPFDSCTILPPKVGGKESGAEGWLIFYRAGRLFQEWPVSALDPAAEPMTIRLQSQGENALAPKDRDGLYYHAGIYRVTGDSLILCLGRGDPQGKPSAPKTFQAPDKSGNTLVTLKRAKTDR